EAHGTLIAGTPILEAHHYEAEQQWIGIMVTPSVLRKINNIEQRAQVSRRRPGELATSYLARTLKGVAVQKCSQIHLKEGLYDGYAIVPLPIVSNTQEIVDALGRVLSKLQWLKQLAPDARSQTKYEHSYLWLNGFSERWQDALQQGARD